jgi:2-keto-4-pentenoate hydratase/2-oxohepta-3-ene-1,7-dioic acid hydratase in catechol pathway
VMISETSHIATLERGDALALAPFDDERRLWPGAVVELAAEGIGTLRNRVGKPA